jgi:hypothetical protein
LRRFAASASFLERPAMSANPPTPLLAKIDLHGYRPAHFIGLPMMTIVQQAWEMGAARLRFVHGHGRARGKSPGFYNTHTGYFGLRIRRELRHNRGLRQWIKYTTLDCGDWGTTTVGLKANPAPTRSALDLTVLPPPSFPDQRRDR